MSTGDMNKANTPPFHLKLFYRTGAFHRPDEFNHPSSSLPPHLTLHTWPTCTLAELAHHLLDASPRILPDPAIGTRLCFRLIYADTRASAARTVMAPRYVTKYLGSVVLGRGGPGAGPEEGVPEDQPDDGAAMTLVDARFITGDFISCAILPPDALTGDVMPASSARTGRGVGLGEARIPANGSVPKRARDNGRLGGFRGRDSRGGGTWGDGRGRHRDWDQPFGRGGGGGSGVPEGEWRRGDKLPDDVPKRGAFWPR